MQTILKEINHNIRSGLLIRVFHGRGRCFPELSDLCIDFYPPVAHVIFYAEPVHGFIEQLSDQLLAAFPERLETVVVQHRYDKEKNHSVIRGTMPPEVFAHEDGLRFQVDLARQQNVGFFSDMRMGRRLVKEISKGKRVLNLFSYTCSFSVAALAGGASNVVNIDMSKKMLAIGRENHRLNGFDVRKCSFLSHHVFKSFAKLAKLGPFQVIIIDPPTFQRGSFHIKKDYPKLLRRITAFCDGGADIIATINAPFVGIDYFAEMIEENLPRVTIVNQFGAPPEFVECGEEVAGLNIFHLRVP